MTVYTAADFRDARFAEHPDGRVAARTAVDWAQWAFNCSECETDEEREECDGHDFGPDGYMASNGWVPVQENPRPLAADDFGQMEAAWKAADNDMAPNDGDTLIIWKGRDWWEIGVALPGRPMDRRIARVLHRPPARPEGAEEWETWLSGLDYLHDETGASRADLATLADDLASEVVGTPKDGAA